MTPNDFYFILDGDIHAHINDSGEYAMNSYNENSDLKFTNISLKYPIDFVLCVGDLTSNGYDGTTGPAVTSCFSKQSNRSDNELAAFRTLYEKPIEKAGHKLYLCIGNHDLPPGHKGVGDYIHKKHKTNWPLLKSKWTGGQYKFKHQGITFLCLGVWPNNLKWLQDNLPTKGKPVLIWYHYNTPIGEQWSDFWSVEDKFRFANVVDGHNIIAICNGHSHNTKLGLFSNIPTIRGSGPKVAIVHIKNNKLHDVYFDTGGNASRVSSTDQLVKFDDWRKKQTKSIKKYDIDNRNDPPALSS